MVELPDSIRGLAGAVLIRGQSFARGWAEGVARHRMAAGSDLIPGSSYGPGLIEYAASQAAVAYCIALEVSAETEPTS